MKKHSVAILAFACVLLLSACGKTNFDDPVHKAIGKGLSQLAESTPAETVVMTTTTATTTTTTTKKTIKATTKAPKTTTTTTTVPVTTTVTTTTTTITTEPPNIISSRYSIGDIIKMGKYEQDSNLNNGEEEIEWQILDIESNKALVISKYILERKEYEKSFSDITWEECTLREWLNTEFIDQVFTDSEKSKIVDTMVVNNGNYTYGTYGGNNTIDKIFILSIDELYLYFDSPDAWICKYTEYIKDHKEPVSIRGDMEWFWWLRTPGYYQYGAAGVYDRGDVTENGFYACLDVGGVRPAMWVELE